MTTEAKIDGLPVPGYRAQAPEAIAAVTVFKHLEEQILQFLDGLQHDVVLDADKRWLATGRTDLEKGFMSINRAIFKPERVRLPGPSLAEQFSE